MKQKYLDDRDALVRRIKQLEISLSSKTHQAANRPIDWWLKCKPPQNYHIDWQVQSLEVFEPEIRDLTSKKKISKYLKDRGPSTPVLGRLTLPQTSRQIRNSIDFADFRLMKAFHLFLDDDFSFVHQSETTVDHPNGSRRKPVTVLDTPVSLDDVCSMIQQLY